MADRRTHFRFLLTIGLGCAGGYAASLLNLPLAWMIGAMVATTAAAMLGAPLYVFSWLRNVMVCVLGVMLGSSFTPAILGVIGDWVLSLAMLAVYIAVAGGSCFLYFRKLCGFDKTTAYFSGMPGGLAEMVIVGESFGGDSRIISLVHGLRVLLVVLIVPFGFQLFLPFSIADRPPPGVPLLELPLDDLAILFAVGVVGYLGSRLLNIPAARLVGPMVLSMAVHLAGWTTASPPTEVIYGAQVVIGAAIGTRFADTSMKLIGRTMIQALGATLILVGFTLVFAAGLTAAVGLPFDAVVLGFAPGGLIEMSLIALALSADTAFVATHHIVRIAFVVIGAPLVFRKGLKPPEGPGSG
ncbi:MAG: AbrB family transcriptional regulator [Rhodovibrionaceae bacterium]